MQVLPATWAEISLSRLRENWEMVRTAVPRDCGLVVILKADAYGHGASACCGLLQDCGAKWFGVSSPAEGRRLREVCPDGKILILSHFVEDCQSILDCNLIPQIWESRQVEALEAAWREHGGNQRMPVHIEVDTGMAQQGVRSVAELDVLLKHCQKNSILCVEGVMTQFCSPESLQPDNTFRQIEEFRERLGHILEQGIKVKYIHAGNSATVFVPAHLEALQELARSCGAVLMIRPGMSLFGHQPRFYPPEVIELPPLRPILSWKTRVMSLRALDIGETAGYDMTFRANRPTRLALVPVGYADGLSRILSNRGVAIVRGRKVLYAGRVSMDLTLLDVTDEPGVSVGDEVILIGEQDEQSVSAYEMADAIGTIPDEVTCSISARVPRIIRR
jgi:alanine racemase